MEQRVRAESPKPLLMKWLIPLGLCFMPVTVANEESVCIYNYAFKMDCIVLKSMMGGVELFHTLSVQKPLN